MRMKTESDEDEIYLAEYMRRVHPEDTEEELGTFASTGENLRFYCVRS